ncbi:MAG: trypsin-like peptidase domain-containing protein [Caldilineaceae bacterium]|nr:trypsin-like peptidase domain-containing protein [Caldilineaceae bacterium]
MVQLKSLPRPARLVSLSLLLALLTTAAVLMAAVRQPVFGQSAPPAGPMLDAGTIYDRMTDSVVRIEATGGDETAFLGDMDLDALQDRLPPAIRNQIQKGFADGRRGSGFFFDNAGHIATSNHVVDGAEAIHVVFADGTFAAAEIVGQDPHSNLAILAVSNLDRVIAPLPVADSTALEIGDSIYAFGYPGNLFGTLTQGIVSGFETGPASETGYSVPNLILSNLNLLPGHSGGPLVNASGEVIGIANGRLQGFRGEGSLSRNVPASMLTRVAPDLIANGSVIYPQLGLSGGNLSVGQAAAIGLDTIHAGAFVNRLQPDGPAASGGIEEGDIVVSLGGNQVRTFSEMVGMLILDYNAGDEVSVGVLRDGKTVDLTVTLGTRS